MSEVETRPYLLGDEEHIVPLLKLAFNGWPFFDLRCSPVDHWRWRYLDKPQHDSLLVEILDEGRIVATGHNVLHDLMIRGKRTLASYGTDACVHPAFQGRGLYRIIVNSLMNMQEAAGVEFNYMVTVDPKVLRSNTQRRATPSTFPYKVKYLERIEDINLHLKMKSITGEYGWKLRHFFEQLSSKSIKPPEGRIHQIERFDEEAEGFLGKVIDSYDYIRHLTPEYLNWRYMDPRGGNYNVQALYLNGEFNGYGVFRINRLEEYHVGYIVDLLTLPNKLSLAESLLLSGLEFFQRNHVNHLVYQVVEGHPYEILFNQYGFYGGEGNRHIFYNNRENEDLIIENIPPEKIHFPFGYLTGI